MFIIVHMFDHDEADSSGPGGSRGGVLSVVRGWASDDFVGLSGADLKTAVIELGLVRAALDAAEAKVLAELDVRGTTDVEDGLRTQGWYAKSLKTSRSEAKRRVVTARKLRSTFPVVAEALKSGVVSFEHAWTFASKTSPRIEPELVEAQSKMVALVEYVPMVDRWRDQFAAMIRLADQDGTYTPEEDRARNFLHFHRQFDGRIRGEFEFVDDLAATFETMINNESQRLFHVYKNDQAQTSDLAMPSQATRQAEALMGLLRRAQNPSDTEAVAPIVELEVLVDAQRPDRLQTTSGYQLSEAAMGMLCCDPVLQAVVIESFDKTGQGVTLNHGRNVRKVTPKQRSALNKRDGGCVFPGCTAPASWCDAHHVLEWLKHEGNTDLNNLILLCRHHHRVLHRKDWQTQRIRPPDAHDHDIRIRITTPNGQQLVSQRHHQLNNPNNTYTDIVDPVARRKQQNEQNQQRWRELQHQALHTHAHHKMTKHTYTWHHMLETTTKQCRAMSN